MGKATAPRKTSSNGKNKKIDRRQKNPDEGANMHDLRKEDVLALGGDEEDYDLLKNLDSDEDVVGKSSRQPDVSYPV